MTALRTAELATAARLIAAFRGTTVPDWLLRRVEDGLGGVLLFAENIVDDSQVAATCQRLREARADVVLAIDEEGGNVTRLDASTGTMTPTPAVLGILDDPALTRRVGAAIGTRLRQLGLDLNLAPVADVNSNPANPIIGVRSFGAEPRLVSRHVATTIAGLHEGGVAACAKHFPGHGDTSTDSHLDRVWSPADLDMLRARELPPFAAAVEAGCDAVMTTHVVVTALDDVPATFSARWHALLREELGFGGAIISDAVDMAGAGGHRGPASLAAAAHRALAAGVDLVCLGSNLTEADVGAVLADCARHSDLTSEMHGTARQRITALRRPTPPETPEGMTADDFVATARRAFRGCPAAEPLLAGRAAALVAECRASCNPSSHNVAWGVRAELPDSWPGLDVHPSDHPRSAAATIASAAAGRPVVLVVRDTAIHHWQLDVLEALVAAGVDTVALELGSPTATPPVPIIRTHSASRASAIAAARWLGQIALTTTNKERRHGG